MKLNSKYKIEKCASRDLTRPSLVDPYYDAERGLLVATNGHVLAAVPVEKVPGPGDGGEEKSGYVLTEEVVKGRKLAKPRKGKEVSYFLVPEVADPKDRKFPNWEQVAPKYRRGDPETVTFNFDVRLLADLAAAIGSDGRVELTIPLDAGRPGFSDDQAPMEVRNTVSCDPRVVGVLMPIRTESVRNDEVPEEEPKVSYMHGRKP